MSTFTAEQSAADELQKRMMAKAGVSSSRDLQCPQARIEYEYGTRCAAKDGRLAVSAVGKCVGCWWLPTTLLKMPSAQV